jgi:transposase
MQRHRHQEFLRFLNAVEAAVPAGKLVHAILDDHGTHKHPKVRAWLARHPRWTFHFVPTSCSWLNAVETFFAKLTRRRLRRGSFHSLVDLQAAIKRYLAEANEDPRPFVWTAKPDDIIEKVRRGYQAFRSVHYLEAHGRPVAFYSDKHSVFRVAKPGITGDGMTQFGRALSKLKIEIICANSSQAKGRVERAHATLQDRLVKELRLAGISDLEAANAFLPGFMESYNSKFARPPAHDLDLHRPLAGTNQLGDVLCWRETRRVSQQLVVHYNQMKFTLHPSEVTARLVGQEVEIYDFPDGRLEIRWKGLPLAYGVFDKLQRVSHAAIVENKRLGEVLAWIKERQDAQPIPSGDRAGPRRSSQKSGLMKDRVDRLAQAATSRPKPARLGRRRSDRKVCAPSTQAPSDPA